MAPVLGAQWQAPRGATGSFTRWSRNRARGSLCAPSAEQRRGGMEEVRQGWRSLLCERLAPLGAWLAVGGSAASWSCVCIARFCNRLVTHEGEGLSHSWRKWVCCQSWCLYVHAWYLSFCKPDPVDSGYEALLGGAKMHVCSVHFLVFWAFPALHAATWLGVTEVISILVRKMCVNDQSSWP